MEKQPLVSVIVPVYNAEKYLCQCVESVLAQSYSAWELILIDDGSTDNSPEICDNFARNYSCVRVIHRSNGGFSAARNTGIDDARGEYISFLDADDMLNIHFLRLTVKAAEENHSQIVCTLHRRFSDENLNFTSQQNTSSSYPAPRSEPVVSIVEKMLYQTGIDNSAWGKLYRKDFWSHFRFREGIGYEDLDLIPGVLLKAERVLILPLQLYLYRQHPQSYIHTFSLRRADSIDVAERLEKILSGNPMLRRAARDRQLSANFNILTLIEANRHKIPSSQSEEALRLADRCWRNIKELRGDSLRNPKVRLKNKIGILASYLGGRPLISLLGRIMPP